MEHGTTLVAILHIFIALVLCVVILLQDTQGGVGGAFGGGGGGGSLLGAGGAENFLSKTTKIFGLLFAGTCIGLTLFLSHKVNHSVLDTVPATPANQSAPANPGAPAQAPAHQ